MLTIQEQVALAAALGSRQVSAAKKAMGDETTTNVDVTVRLVGTSAKGKKPAPRQATQRAEHETVLQITMDEAITNARRGAGGRWKDSVEVVQALEDFRVLFFENLAKQIQEDIDNLGNPAKLKKGKKERKDLAKSGESQRKWIERKKAIEFPTSQSEATVSVAVDIEVIDSELIRNPPAPSLVELAEATDTEKDES